MAEQIVTFTLVGARETMEALRTMLPDRTAKNIMKRTLRKRAEPFAARMAAQAPVKTGQLKTSVGSGTRLSAKQRSEFRKEHEDDVVIHVGAGPLPQAHLIEYGASHMTPQPFARPAWDAEKMGMLKDLLQDMKQEIDKAAARAARKAAKVVAGGS